MRMDAAAAPGDWLAALARLLRWLRDRERAGGPAGKSGADAPAPARKPNRKGVPNV